MRGFMAHERADRTIIQRIIGIRVEERRLEDGRGKINRVVTRRIEGIDCLWRRDPARAIGGLAYLHDVVAVVEFGSCLHVLVVSPWVISSPDQSRHVSG